MKQCLLLPFGVLCLLLPQIASGALVTPPRPRTFVEFLAACQDVVVEGTVLEAHETKRRFAETCGVTGLMPLLWTEVRLRVDRVYSGVIEDSVLAISADGHGYFTGNPVGTRVIAWGNRICDDGWRIHAVLAVILEDGTIAGRLGRAVYPSENRESSTLTASQLGAQIGVFDSQPTRVLEGASAVALARRADRDRLTATGATFHLDSLEWLIGQGSRVPRCLSFPLMPGCYPDIYPGDSLLVPIPPGFGDSDTLYLHQCPSALRVEHGFAPGLAVAIDKEQLQRVLVRIGSALRIRRVLSSAAQR